MNNLSLILILALGGFFRFYNNTAIALWHDEAFSSLFLRYSWSEMLHRIALDVHPPLYYIVLRLWSYFAGDGLLSLRLLSITFGVLTIWAGYLFVKATFRNKTAAVLAGLLLAVSPFQIQYALEARMYTLGTFLLLWSSYFLVEALNSGRKKHWIWYGVTAAACLYTHYYLIFSIAAQGLFILYSVINRKKISGLIGGLSAYILAFTLYLPWLKVFAEQTSRVQQAYWIPPINRWSIPETIWKMAFGGQGIARAVLVVSCLVTFLILIYFFKRVKSHAKWLVLLGLLVPFLGAIFLSFRTNLYLDRYFVFASLFFTILLALTFYHLPNRIFRWIAIGALLGASIFAFFKNWTDLSIQNKPGMTAASELVNFNAAPSDNIYVGSSFIYFTFKYYNQTQIRPLLYSGAPLEEIPHFSGTALLDPDDLIMDFAKTPKKSTVWLLWTTGFGGSKPQVPGNWKQIEEQSYQDSPGFKGSIFVSRYQVQ